MTTHNRPAPTNGPDLARAMNNPSAIFASPEEVLGHPQLSRAEKIELLQRWELDAVERQVAQEEGMIGQDRPDVLQQISIALQQLTDDEDVEHPGPTKHRVRDRTRDQTGKGGRRG